MEVNGVTEEQPVPATSPQLPDELASILDTVYSEGVLAKGELDSRALDAAKDLSSEELSAVFAELKESNLEHVSNKSAFLCGLIKSHRQKARKLLKTGQLPGKRVGPDETKLKEILDRTGYPLDVSTGQRKYGGPPPEWEGASPGTGHEIYCGRIPKDIFEDTLIPIFEKYGTIWDLRLMMDPITGRNRGYCFVTYADKKDVQNAVSKLNNFEIKPGKPLRVNVTASNVRLFVGNIPKNRTREDLLKEFQKHTEGLVDVIVYSSPDDPKKKNRGFAFLDYSTHKMASAAKRHMTQTRLHVWGLEVIVDWADPQEEPNEEAMSKVKVLYVRNLKSDTTEEQLKEMFQTYGSIERVKKVKGYGFVHFSDREAALKAMQELNGTKIDDLEMEISLAKPLSKNKQKNRLRNAYNNFPYAGYDEPWNYYSVQGIQRKGRNGNRMREFNYYSYPDYYNQGYMSPGYGYYDYYGGGGRYGAGYNYYRDGYSNSGNKSWWFPNNQRSWSNNKALHFKKNTGRV